MNIIRITKSKKERFDAIFTGSKYFFLNPTFGLIAVASRKEQNSKNPYATHFDIERTEQISKQMIIDVITENERTCTCFNVVYPHFKNEDNLPQHTLPYLVDAVLIDPKTSTKLTEE